jgi:hypothetical protein
MRTKMAGKAAAGSGERMDKIFADLAKVQRLATNSHVVNRPVTATASELEIPG